MITTTKEDFEEYQLYIISLYDEYIYTTEKRGASYGEIAYLQNLKEQELEELESEILKELEKTKGVK